MPASDTLTPGNLGKLAKFKPRKASDDKSLPSMMLYGGPGTGKTTLAASASEVPEMSPVLHLNIENGTQSIKDVYPDVTVIDVTKFQQLQDICDALYEEADYENNTVAGFRTVIVDNCTEGQKKGMEHIYRAENARAKAGITFTEFSMPSFSNGGWNISSEQMRKFIRAFRELPAYVILVCWEMDSNKSEDTDRKLWTPAFTSTLANEAPGMVNDVYRLALNRDGERVLTSSRTPMIVAKDRSRKLPRELTNPTMRQIFDYWSGTLVKSAEDDAPKSRTTLKKKV